MTDTAIAPAPIGHNLPDAHEELVIRTDDLVATANRWAGERPELTDEEMAGKCADYLEQIRKCGQAIDAEVKSQRDPYNVLLAAISLQFKPLKTKLDVIKAVLKPRLDEYMNKKKAREDAEAQRLRAEAEEARRIADAAAEAAEAGKGPSIIDDHVRELETEAAAAEAEKAAGQAERAPTHLYSEFGTRATSLRTARKGRIVDVRKALNHYRDHEWVVEALQRAINADLRHDKGKTVIPGVEIIETASAA